MEILYISNTTSKKYFDELFKISHVKPGQQVQKFNEMLLRGFASSKDNNVHALSVAPATHSTCSKKRFKNEKETENNITYDYVGFINYPIAKQVCVHGNAKRKIRKWIKNTKGHERVILCYALSPTLSSIALSVAKKHNIKCVAVVTDIPELMNVEKNTSGVKEKLNNIYAKSTFDKMTQYDMYVLLTDAMSEVVNPNQKPYIVVEGMVDSDMQYVENTLSGKYRPKVILYAGALYEKYGVRNLIEGFIIADVGNCQLWIFGRGEMDEYLENLDNERVKFFGVKENTEVIKSELSASLLINPRPSTEEFTKYSFPSKNLEYMASGTPVLACKLPGMPSEYLDYVYIAEDESSQGFAKSISKIMALKAGERVAFGRSAKGFVMQNKTNVKQAHRIIDFIKENLL